MLEVSMAIMCQENREGYIGESNEESESTRYILHE
jgi:hypothetical protein